MEKTSNRTIEVNKKIIILTVLLMVVLAVGMYLYVQRSIHNERVAHLDAQTKTTRNLINKTIEEYCNYANICEGIVSDKLHDGDDVYDFLTNATDLIFMGNANLILIDSNCNWYSGVNHSGRINEVDKYTSDTKDQEIYITQEVFSGKDCIVCRNRLSEAISVKTETGSAVIEYCGVICYFDDMSREFSVAFPYTCNKFVLDSRGGMLYKYFGIGVLMGGTNIFAKYDRANFLFGDNAEELLEDVKAGHTSIAEFKNAGERYFICTSRLKYNHWYVCYVINSNEIASGSYVKIVILFILGMCLIFTIALSMSIFSTMRMKLLRKEAEAEHNEKEILAQVAKTKSEFLSNMSHDIRTPINGIMGMTALALKEDNPDKTNGYLKKIDNVSHHLLSLVNDVLDMSSIEGGKLTINKRITDMSKLPDDCVAMIQSQAEAAGLEILTEFESLEHPIVHADELKIRQILLNILGNAVKYTPSGGAITFRVRECGVEDNMVKFILEVEDTGIGMSKEFLEHIWESFAQEEGGSRTNYKGTGLGMSITKHFVELMGGSIDVESEMDKGSKFTVELALEIAGAAQEEIVVSEGGMNLDGIRILLAEDNEINLEIAKALLEDEGAEIHVARNGREAVEIFSESELACFDVILMDEMMPEMHGTEACRLIRSMERDDAKSVPIIAMTANAYKDDIKASRDAGMNAHLTKPLNMEIMIKTICKLCSR